MIDIQKIAEQAGLYVGANISGIKLVGGGINGTLLLHLTLEELEKFAALYREAVVQELVAGSGEPVAYRTEDSTNGVNVWLFKKTAVKYQDPPDALYTADQLAGAVARERERCANLVADLSDMRVPASEYAAAIRGQT